MNVYTYTQARRRLASVLDEAERDGEVRITRRDGRTFVLRPVPPAERGRSPLDVPAVEGTGGELGITLDEITGALREGRDRGHGV